MLYDLLETARMRLNGCVVMLDGEPILVNEIHQADGGVLSAQYYELPFPEEPRQRNIPMKLVRLDNPGLEIFKFKLGYMNTRVNNKHQALFFSRQPSRQNRQGLHSQVVVVRGNGNRNGFGNMSAYYTSREFRDMMVGLYPTLPNAVKTLEQEDVDSVAVSRVFSLSKTMGRDFPIHLYYKGTPVGWGESCERFTLTREYMFVRELAQDLGINTRGAA